MGTQTVCISVFKYGDEDLPCELLSAERAEKLEWQSRCMKLTQEATATTSDLYRVEAELAKTKRELLELETYIDGEE